MRNLFAAILVLNATSAFAGHPWGSNVHTLDDFRNDKTHSAPMTAAPAGMALKTRTEVVVLEEEAQKPATTGSTAIPVADNTFEENITTLLQGAAVVTAAGIAYVYGPAALFWGTYYVSCWGLSKVGITGITGICAATKAGILVADSAAAATAVAAVSGFVAHYGAKGVVKTAKFAGHTAWSLGGFAFRGAQSAAGWFWSSSSQEEGPAQQTTTPNGRRMLGTLTAPLSPEELRPLRLQRFATQAVTAAA